CHCRGAADPCRRQPTGCATAKGRNPGAAGGGAVGAAQPTGAKSGSAGIAGLLPETSPPLGRSRSSLEGSLAPPSAADLLRGIGGGSGSRCPGGRADRARAALERLVSTDAASTVGGGALGLELRIAHLESLDDDIGRSAGP